VNEQQQNKRHDKERPTNVITEIILMFQGNTILFPTSHQHERDEEELQKLFFNAHFTAPKHCFIYETAFPELKLSFGKSDF